MKDGSRSTPRSSCRKRSCCAVFPETFPLCDLRVRRCLFKPFVVFVQFGYNHLLLSTCRSWEI